MKWANKVHNILNFLGLLVGAVIVYDWTMLGMSDAQAAKLTATVLVVDKVLKLGINITRDGLAGLWKEQPPVVK